MTICTQNRGMLFGEIVGADSISARMVLNDVGIMVENLYHDTYREFQNVTSLK